GGGKQKGTRPLEFVGEELVRRLFHKALTALTPEQRLELFPAPGLGRWGRRLGLGSSQAQERTQWLLANLGRPRRTPPAAPPPAAAASRAAGGGNRPRPPWAPTATAPGGPTPPA